HQDPAHVKKAIERAILRRKRAVGDGSLFLDLKRCRILQLTRMPAPRDLGAHQQGVTVAGWNIPALHLSGDGFDFEFSPALRRLLFLLCDVSGKGPSGAMIAQELISAFRRGV